MTKCKKRNRNKIKKNIILSLTIACVLANPIKGLKYTTTHRPYVRHLKVNDIYKN